MTAAPPFDPLGALPRGRTLLEASAGTGKTHTIASLVLRHVAEEGVALPRLLVVTFTRAAAGELGDRVRTRLLRAAAALDGGDDGGDEVVAGLRDGAADDAELRRRARRLAEAAARIDEATISTIHGFCQRMLTTAALEAGVDLDAALVDDERPLVAEVVDDLVGRRTRGLGPEACAYLAATTGLAPSPLEHVVAEAVAGGGRRILPPPPAGADLDDLAASWRAALAAFRDAWERHRSGLVDELADLSRAKCIKGWGKRKDGRQSIDVAIEAADDLLAEDPRLPPPTAGDWLSGDPAPEHGPAWFAARHRARAEVDHPVLLAAERLTTAAAEPASLWLAALARDGRELLADRKRRRGLLSYDDQLGALAEAMDDPARRDAVVAAIRRRYDAALIDEFQDTDPVQWRVFSHAFADAPLVLIGDPKQAIYAFRGADLRTYQRARRSAEAQATLTVSHRSGQRHLDAVNALFARPGAFAAEGIAAPPVTAAEGCAGQGLVRPDGDDDAALLLRWVPMALAEADGGRDGSAVTKGWAERRLPTDVAAQAVGLVRAGRLRDGDGGQRALTAGDLAVLVRTNRQVDLVCAALADAGLPATRTRAGSVLATEESAWLQRLLEALLEPRRQPLARAAAVTPPFGWTAADLADPEREREWDAWLASLQRWSALWHRRGAMTALRAALAETDALARLLAAPQGERLATNVEHLAERLHAAEQARRLGPAALLAWLRSAREEADAAGPDEDQQLRLDRDDAAVQVLTVHAAKGLEFPVVLCPFLWSVPGGGQRLAVRCADPDDEAPVVDVGLDPHEPRRAASLASAEEDARAEERRLAYVALTRARAGSLVWWGPFRGAADSPLGALLHGDGAEAALADDDALRAALTEVPGRGAGLGVVEVATIAPARWEGADGHGAAPALAARPWTRRLDAAWRRTSFTALTRDAGVGDDAAELGRDTDDDPADPPRLDAPAEADEEVPLGPLPRGPAFGDAAHQLLEHADFAADAAELEGLADALLHRHPGLAPGQRPRLADGLARALATPLGTALDDARLADVGRGDRLDELAFELPLAGGEAPRGAVSVDLLGEALAAHPDGRAAAAALASLAPAARRRAVRGFLAGAIDLVARLPGGRFLVVDYKTTWLGQRDEEGRPLRATRWHYRPEALEAAMRPHAYHLQAVLYLVAVHRHLRARLGQGYDFSRDVAGVAYLFLRGMTGPDARGADGASAGVWTWGPSAALVDDVSRALAEGAR